ncbi:MAG: DUF2283 domain-containing protein [Nitrosomonadales bacterium]|nr:MAG: DUF2283 domain-containing protein [Nitrosomonadales bacterium]
MKIEFDPIADALYLELAEGVIDKTEEVRPGVLIDFDRDGNTLGIELLYVSKRQSLPIKEAA